jgi:thioredoxin 2
MMSNGSALLRCRSCRTVNRVPVGRLAEKPKCGKCKAYLDFPHAPVEGTAANFDSEVLDSPGLVLVFFWAPWCAHCRGMMPSIQELARRMAGRLKVVMVNTEKETPLARRFDVMSLPRLTLYRGGQQVNELNGAVSSTQLNEWIGYWMG